MMYDPPAYVWIIEFVGLASIPALTCFVLYRGAQRAGLGRGRAAWLAGVAAVVLGGWFAGSAVIAGRGWYHTKLGEQPPWLLIAAVTTLLSLLAASRIPVVSRALSAPDTASRLALPHAPRVLGVVFLVMMFLGQLPALFALPAGLGDISVGIAAPFVARRLSQGSGLHGARWFNVLGIIDLVVAQVLGAMIGFQLFGLTARYDAIGELPLAVIPTAGVPLLIVLHILSLRRLATSRAVALDAH